MTGIYPGPEQAVRVVSVPYSSGVALTEGFLPVAPLQSLVSVPYSSGVALTGGSDSPFNLIQLWFQSPTHRELP